MPAAEILVRKPLPGRRAIAHLGDRIVCVFNVAGSIRVYEDNCPHQGGPVCRGAIGDSLEVTEVDGSRVPTWTREGDVLACPWHGLEFSLSTGRCLSLPRLRLRAIPFEDRGEDVVLTLGEHDTSGAFTPLLGFEAAGAAS